MSGSKAGGAKAAATNIDRYGEDFYKRIGTKGGSATKTSPSGFAARRDIARSAGRKGGKVTAKMRWGKDV